MNDRDNTPWGIWTKSLKFYLDNAPKFLIILPLLFVPVYVDTLLTVLILQDRKRGRISMTQALLIALSNTATVFIIKLRFEVLGALWSLIPIYGWYKSFRYRIQWAMASNVVIHEELSGELAVVRCKELTEMSPPDKGFRTLVTIPALIESVLFIGILIGTVTTKDPTIFGLCFLGLFWTWMPWSAAVNTYFYFTLPQEAVESTLHLRKETSPQDFCPICVHYSEDPGFCTKLTMNVLEYPSHFSKYCASIYYEPRDAV